jgi:hypothetical protein
MNYAVEMGLGAIKCMPSFIKIACALTHTYRKVVSYAYFCFVKIRKVD